MMAGDSTASPGTKRSLDLVCRPLHRFARLGLIAAVLLAAAPASASAASSDWPTYHRDLARSGNDPTENPVTAIAPDWTSPALDGEVYAEPLVVGNLVIVATEGDSIYALDATNGTQVWKTNVGNPVTISSANGFGCGNISPLGITGTPVVQVGASLSTSTVYAVAFEQPANYFLVGLNLATGAQVFPQVAIAPTGFNSHVQQQRSALQLSGGMVYVAYGGYAGDCGNYHGWVVAVPASGSGTQDVFQDQSTLPPAQGAREAGMWAASGPAVDGSGNVYVASGNGGDTTTFDFGETVFKLSPTLSRLDYWAPTVWPTLNGGDTDIGSVGPLLVGAGNSMIFQTGKSGWGYLLNVANLSPGGVHIGSEPFSAQVCDAATDQTAAGDQVFGGLAYADPLIYVPCPEGIKALRLAAGPSFSVAWSGPNFQAGSPIVAGGIVWTLNLNNGDLVGLDAATGVQRFASPVGGLKHFATPTTSGGRIFAASGNQVVAFGPGAGQYHPLDPTRILDTRQAGGAVGAGQTRTVPVTGHGGVPASGVSAVVINVTVVNTTAPSFLSVYPTGFTRPLSSNLNWVAGRTVANLVEVAVGNGGAVSVFNSAGSTDVVIDVAGWVQTSTVTPGPDGLYTPLVPARVLDTRTAGPSIGPNSTRVLQLTGQGGIPASGVEAVVLNLTATNPTARSFLTVFPTGGAQPNVSNLNFNPGQTIPNRVVVKLGTGGHVTIYNAAGTVDAIVDVGGWFTDASNPAATGSLFVAAVPVRILDTRNGTGGFGAPVGPGATIALPVAGHGGVPAMNAPTPPTAVVLNVTVTGPTASSHLTVWPAGVGQPLASDLNFQAGQTVPNLVIVQIGASGNVDIFNAAGSTNVIADVLGWYQ